MPVLAGSAAVSGSPGTENAVLEQPRLVLGKPQIGGADRAQAGAREVGGTPAAAQPAELGLHRNGQRRQRRRAHRLEQIVAAGEVPVGRVGDNAGAPRRLAQHHSIGTAVARQFDASFKQRSPQIAMAIRAARRWAGRHIGHHSSVNMWTLSISVVMVLWTVYT